MACLGGGRSCPSNITYIPHAQDTLDLFDSRARLRLNLDVPNSPARRCDPPAPDVLRNVRRAAHLRRQVSSAVLQSQRLVFNWVRSVSTTQLWTSARPQSSSSLSWTQAPPTSSSNRPSRQTRAATARRPGRSTTPPLLLPRTCPQRSSTSPTGSVRSKDRKSVV